MKKYEEINKLVDEIEKDLIQFFRDYGITDIYKKDGFHPFYWECSGNSIDVKLAREVLYSIRYLRFVEGIAQDKESHIEQFGILCGLFSSFLYLFVFSTPRENIYDNKKYSSLSPRSNFSKLKVRLYRL